MAVIAAIREHELRAHQGALAESQAAAEARSPLPGAAAPSSPPAGLTDAKKREFEALAAELRTLRQQAAQAEATQQAAADDGERSGTPAVLINSLGMQLKLVPAGTFRMGQNPSAVVTISAPFYLGVYEVSQAECAALLGERKHPGASGTEADTFCLRLSRLPEELAAGRVYRLPTEAEWEYACRAGTETAYAFGDDPALPAEQAAGRVYRLPTEAEWEYACRAGSAVSPSADNDDAVLQDAAWDDHNAQGQTHPVGQTQPNAWGLYDMRGNVWEWCSDWYAAYPAGSVRDPQGPSTGAFRVCRGGSWAYPARFHRPTLRGWRKPTSRGASFGFRLVLSPPEPAVTDG